GSMGHASDVVWAANIAAAIGKKAYNVSTASATGGDVVVEVGAQGATTISGDGRLFNDMEMDTGITTWSNTLRNTQMPNLFDGDVEYYDYSDTKKTLKNVKESVTVDITDVYFEKDKDTEAIIAKIPARGVVYTLDLGSTGIRVLDGTKDLLTVGGDHDVEIPFLGQMYKIRSLVGDKLTLVSNQDKMTYMQGSEFTLGDYVVNVSTITSGTPNRVLLELTQNGSVVKSESVRDGKSTTFGGLTDEITVTQVNYASDQLGYIEVSKGSGVLELENREEVDTFTDEQDREWEVEWTLDGTSAEYLQKITLTNVDGWNGLGDSDYPALKIGDKAMLPMDVGSVYFAGLKDETMYDFKVENKRIKWSDKSYDYDIPVYVEKSFSAGSETNMKFTVDNKDYYLIRADDGTSPVTYTISTTNDVADVVTGSVWNGSLAYVAGDLDLVAGDSFTITSDLTSNTTHYFTLNESGSKMAISLSVALDGSANGIIGNDVEWEFTGTDNTSTDWTSLDQDLKYYDGLSVSAKGEALAHFVITDNDASTETVTFVMDTYLNRLADEDDYAGIDKVTYTGNAAFTLDDDDSDDLRKGYTLSGAEIEVSSKNLIASFPEVAKNFEIFVGGETTSTTSLNGGEVTLTTPGEVVETEDGKISVKLVSAPEGSATTYTPAAFGNIAYLDTDTLPAGNKIIVGGWMVNEQAQTLGLEDLITTAGDYVAGKNAQGNIVVAGFHKEDTANAAKELITAIEAMN
ncbi:MAG: hypothetical protein PHC31_13465, partial [Clostridia bacterium]|nr:hypothetical protein [Clostridia bacterium]